MSKQCRERRRNKRSVGTGDTPSKPGEEGEQDSGAVRSKEQEAGGGGAKELTEGAPRTGYEPH